MSLRHFWRRWSLRRRQYAGGAPVLDALYEGADPWNLASPPEQARFAATNTLIAAECGPVASLLEVGCGEGLQTRHLMTLADHVTGIDLSANALARAAANAPGAMLLEGELAALVPGLPRAHYDVATLCEVLYYMPDPAAVLAQVQALADHVVVTVYAPQAARLAPLMAGAGWREMPAIASSKRRWRAWVWHRGR